ILASLYNCSRLLKLGLYSNHLEGGVPSELGSLTKLGKNNLKRKLPASLGNLTSLRFLASSLIWNLQPHIRELYLGRIYLTGVIPTTLPNILPLQKLGIEYNSFIGSISPSFGKLWNLQYLALHGNSLGSYSFGDLEFIGALTNCTQLHTLSVGENRQLPVSLGKFLRLGVLILHSNRLLGEIPSLMDNITRLERLYLYNNSFEGTIPPSLGRCSHLLYFYVRYKKLNGTITRKIMQISPILTLSIPHNSLTGSLPKDLPQTLGKCLPMRNLYLQGNFFYGDILDIKGLLGVKRVDFLENNLSGSIPEYFVYFPSLEYLNLSINNFNGMVPTEGRFQNATIVSVFGNKDLCGGIREFILNSCLAQVPPVETEHSSQLKKDAIGVSIGIAFLLLFFIAYVSLYGFSSTNMIGSGSFGTVFKAFLLTQNKVVAVKVLNLQRLQPNITMKIFVAECETLRDIMHHNLVKLLTTCTSIDYQGKEFRALIYEFMPNGSLDMWMYPEEVEEICRPSRTLTLLERLNIAINVASVLEYLHDHWGQPSIHGDVYSFGLLLLNMFTGKQPTNYPKSVLSEKVLDIADKSIFQSGLRVGFPVVESLTLFWRALKNIKELISIKELFKTRRTARN
ncbi:hypothetical protein EUTSA_v100110810mg, partial [Eutrema salsugineum]